MERILIIGGNGCGKTTLSCQLAERLSLPLVHLDALYWGDNWQPIPEERFDRLLQRELEKPRWIIDGNITRTLPRRLRYCDMVIVMDFSRSRCLLGAVKRVLKSYGKSRPDMGGNCPERLNREKLRFLWSIWRNHETQRKKWYTALDGARSVRRVTLKNRRQVRAFLAGL